MISNDTVWFDGYEAIVWVLEAITGSHLWGWRLAKMRPKWIAAKAAKLFVGDSPGRSIGGSTEADILQHMAAHLHQIYIKSITNIKKPIETLTNHLWHQLDPHLTNLHLQWLSRVYPWSEGIQTILQPPRMCVTCGISAGRRSAVGSSSERSSVCQPRCSRATSHQPRQPGCLSKQYICTFHSGYESRICKWFVTCCYSCFFRCESSSESIQASNLEG